MDKVKLSIREIQLAEEKMMEEFDSFCEENNLRYYMGGGTLLGAVRHKGFIPWDDDVDLYMPRPDCERLEALLNGKELNHHIILGSPHFNTLDFPMLKLLDKNIIIERENGIAESPYLWIDIMPLDGLPDDPTILDRKCRKIERLKGDLFISKNGSVNYVKKGAFRDLLSTAKRLVLLKLGPSYFVNRIEKISKAIPYDGSQFVGNIAWERSCRARLLRTEYDDVIKLQFESGYYPAPACYDKYLRKKYGDDYLEIPPVEKRETHDLSAWRVKR